MKKKILTKFNKKTFLLYFLVGFILLTAIVAGSTLVGLGFPNFSQFLEFKSYYLTLRLDLSGFDQAWTEYNNLATTNGWIVANIEMFVIGTILMITFLILLIVFISLYILKKKTNKNESVLNISNTDIEVNKIENKVKKSSKKKDK
ncbi:MAG: hypothetical protein RR697_03445 [Malacoplasma sp.]